MVRLAVPDTAYLFAVEDKMFVSKVKESYPVPELCFCNTEEDIISTFMPFIYNIKFKEIYFMVMCLWLLSVFNL